MRKIGFIAALALLLGGCGSGQNVLDSKDSLPDSNIITTNSDVPVTNVSGPVSKSNDPDLENFVKLTHSASYNGYLVVQLSKAPGVYVDNNRLVVGSRQLVAGAKTLNDILDKVGKGAQLDSLFKVGGSGRLLENYVRQLEVLSNKKLPALNAFYKITVANASQAEDLLRRLWKEAGIGSVHPGLKRSPMGLETIPDLSGRQGYLFGPTFGGLSIDAAWNRGVKGANVKILDSEIDWNPAHENLVKQPTIQSSGEGAADAKAHGTAVLGILVADGSNNNGVKGVAPNATILTGALLDDRAAAIGALNGQRDHENPGDILLYETGAYPGPLGQMPLETYNDIFAAIQVGVADGLVVIEPATNGGVNLNDASLYGIVDHTDLRISDSGAIMVGASQGMNLARASWSDCGSRVNVFAWGQGITTTSYPGAGLDWQGSLSFVNDANQPNLYYTNIFGGTSASSAIIAGAAALLQSHAREQMGGKKYLAPEKIREFLVSSGVPASSDGGCNIGVQPRMDVALQLFDNFWSGIRTDFPELGTTSEIRGDRRRALRARGVGLICKLYDTDLANSDPQCPEVAKCVLDPKYQTEYGCGGAEVCSFQVTLPDSPGSPDIVSGCVSTRCLPIDVDQSDYDCMAGAIWPTGLRIAKTLDFDGDSRADLVNWTPTKWQIDLSSKNDLGVWDLDFVPPPVPSSTGAVWPVVEDYNSDGRADFAVYDKDHGTWYIKFTTTALLKAAKTTDPATWGWDWQITYPYHDELSRDVTQTKYGRPVPGDYNGDGYMDIALARSDGIWSIDFGGPSRSDYGVFDKNITYLTPQQLVAAPGWAYLPVVHSSVFSEDKQVGMSFKIPDGIPNAGQWWEVFLGWEGVPEGTIYSDPSVFGGNDYIPIGSYGVKSLNGSWSLWEFLNANGGSLVQPAPNGIFGGLECHPFTADFDKDGYDDRAVQCPTEFRIVLSKTNTLQRIPLGYNANEFSLPGKTYVGSISYASTQKLIQLQLNSSSAPPSIPVDMMQSSFCSLPWGPGQLPPECL